MDKGRPHSLRNNIYMMKLAWEICPKRVVADFLIAAARYFSWIFYSVIFIKYLFGVIQAKVPFERIALFILGSMVIFLFISLFSNWYQYKFKPVTDSILYSKINEKLYSKATEVDISCYEDTEFYNSYTLAIKEADIRMNSVLSSITEIVFATISAIGVFATMFSIDKYVILFVVLPLTGKFVFGRIMNKIRYKRDTESVQHQRKMNYINRTIYLKEFAKELRLFNIFNVLKKTYDSGYNGVLHIVDKYAVKSVLIDISEVFFTFQAIFEGILLYGAYRALVSKTMVISDFAVLASAMATATWLLIGLSGNVIGIYENGLYIGNLRKFLDYKPGISENQPGITPDRKLDAIVFDNVSFRYKGHDTAVLRNINLKIAYKEKIAVVGHNGAGKSSLIKLLMRLYDPTEGKISLNGQDIKGFDVKQYRGLFGTAFQDFQILSLSVAENVLMKDFETDEEKNTVINALMQSGIYDKIMSLPNSIDTVLTREFDMDGVVLSGGEYQKIAISRAFARDYEIAVFDEPSSALDPIAEYRLYESMMEACSGKTVIFISHRLSSAVLADRVYMFENGTVAEEGTHNQLMQKGRKYADMFKKQAEKYIDDVDYEPGSKVYCEDGEILL